MFKTNGRPFAPGEQKLGWTSQILPWASKNYNRLFKDGHFFNISGRLSENFSLKHWWGNLLMIFLDLIHQWFSRMTVSLVKIIGELPQEWSKIIIYGKPPTILFIFYVLFHWSLLSPTLTVSDRPISKSMAQVCCCLETLGLVPATLSGVIPHKRYYSASVNYARTGLKWDLRLSWLWLSSG